MTEITFRRTQVAFLSLAFAFVLGCGPTGPVNEKVTLENIKKVKPGMKLTEIESILGPAEASTPPTSYDAAKDGKLDFKKWQHSPKGHNIIVGFDATSEAALVDNTK